MTGAPRAPRIRPPASAALIVLLTIGVVFAWSVFRAGPASAHALAESSVPPAGATLTTAPTSVTITFSETPDPKLSAIQVLDSNGQQHQVGRAKPVPHHPSTLQVGVGSLTPGVYTVTWRTVSEVDGHLATGSFAFGFKVTPTGTEAGAGVVKSPPASLAAVASRWLIYAGLMGLVGTAEIGLLAGPLRRLRYFAAFGAAAAAAGIIGLEEQQRRSDGIPLAHLWASSLGHQMTDRAIPVLAAAGLAIVIWRRPQSRLPLILLGLAGLGGMVADVEASHAAGERSWPWFKVATQVLHFAAAGAWIGGLAVLVGVIGAIEAWRRVRVARRFSAVALVAVVAVAATGLLRGLDEIRTWHGLFDTTFGRWAMLKIALLVVLTMLGLLNRTRGVKRADQSSAQLLRRVASAELGFAAVVLVAAGFLQSLAPPSTTVHSGGPAPLVLNGADFATTVKVRLEVSPGTVGFDRFSLRVLDYDTLKPVAGAKTSLTFALPAQPNLGSSTLNLSPAGAGTYQAEAPNLSVAGTWDVTALVQTAASSAEVPFALTTRTPPEKIEAVNSPGLPTVYTIDVTSDVSLQVYLDPGKPGFNEFHVTAIGSNGNEIDTSMVTVTGGPKAGPATSLTVRRLDNVGHFVADLPGAIRNKYQFVINATTVEGQVHADITIPVS